MTEENVNNEQALNETEATEVDKVAEENKEESNEQEYTIDFLSDKFLNEMETLKTSNAELKAQNQALLKTLEKEIFKGGGVISRNSENNTKQAEKQYNTSAETYKQPSSIEELRGKLL